MQSRESLWWSDNVQDCDIVESEFELKSRYNVHIQVNTLRKSIEPPVSLCYLLKSITALILQGRFWNWITHNLWYAIKQRNHA